MVATKPGIRGILARRDMRLLASSTLTNALGNGLYTVGSMLFFTRWDRLSVAQVGVGLTIAGVIGLIAAVPIGAACDRYGAKITFQALLALQGVAVIAFIFISGFWPFTGIAALNATGMKAGRAANNILIADLAGEDRVTARTFLRATNNLGLAAGSLLGGIALSINTRDAYGELLLADALTFILALFLLTGVTLPSKTRVSRAHREWAALRDLHYISLTAANGLMSLQYFVLTLGLPLWVADHTAAPKSIVAVLLAINTIMVAAGQMWAGRGVTGRSTAGTYLRRAGLVFLGSMALFGVAGRSPAPVAIGLLLLAVTIHTLAEMWQAAGAFEISFSHAPSHSIGMYQAVFNLGMSGAETLAPAIITAACLGLGFPGWILLGALFAFSGILMPLISSKAENADQQDVMEKA
jgi:predicted MFS family arabinose efflux permease